MAATDVEVASWVRRLGSTAVLSTMAGGSLLLVAGLTGLAPLTLSVLGSALFLLGTVVAVAVFIVQARASNLSFLGVAWRTVRELARWLFWMSP